MPEKPKRQITDASSRLRPGQDFIVTKKQASHFPSVGMTLSSYQKAQTAPQPVEAAKKPRLIKRLFKKITIKRTIITLIILILAAGGYYGGKFAYDLHKAFGGSIFDLLHTAKLNGEDQGRVNILLAGDSADDPNHQGADLTDSIMVVSLDTRNNTGWELSIPRDLWVDSSNDSYEKINAIYEQNGMTGLEKMVSQKLNIPIDYYALIDYTAFRDAVNAVGGITIDIQSDNPYGLYDAFTHLKLPNGEVTLDGQQALDLARARGDDSAGDISYGFPDGDFDRTEHQRQMLIALEEKATQTSVLANPSKLGSLFDAIGNNVKTDLNLSDVRRLYQLSKLIPQSKIKSLSLNNDNGQSLLSDYESYDGESALIPSAGMNNYSDIQAFVAKYTSNNPIVQEGATVVVLNGTETDGLASDYRSKLQNLHIDVDQIGDAYSYDIPTTEIIDNSGGKMPKTKAALEQLLGTNVTTTNPYGSAYSEDFIVILGNDKANPTTQ